MKAREWFDEKLAQFENDPEFIAEELALDIVVSLNKAMNRKGISRKELADRLGTSPAFVSGVLNGKPNMTLLTLARFATALNQRVVIEVSDRAVIDPRGFQNWKRVERLWPAGLQIISDPEGVQANALRLAA